MYKQLAILALLIGLTTGANIINGPSRQKQTELESAIFHTNEPVQTDKMVGILLELQKIYRQQGDHNLTPRDKWMREHVATLYEILNVP